MGALDGKVAVVAGATSGIGAHIATLFAQEGASVVLAGRRAREGETLAAEIGGVFQRADVTVEADVARLIGRTLDRSGRLDVMVNNAGGPGCMRSIADVELEPFKRTYALHVGGTLLGMKYAARAMIDQVGGSIVNVASINARLAGWSSADYSSAKAAVVQLTRCAAVELGEHYIRVNSISPGPILTGIFGKGAGIDPATADATAHSLEPVFLKALESYQPIRLAGLVDHVAPLALWLASDASSFVTGQDIAVDGGITAGRPPSVAAAERAMLADALAATAPPIAT